MCVTRSSLPAERAGATLQPDHGSVQPECAQVLESLHGGGGGGGGEGDPLAYGRWHGAS